MTRYKNNAMKEARMECQVKQLEKENTGLRNHVFSLQGEVYGARLAAKYLDKELAGRYMYCSKTNWKGNLEKNPQVISDKLIDSHFKLYGVCS